jgi:hypothetical protein
VTRLGFYLSTRLLIPFRPHPESTAAHAAIVELISDTGMSPGRNTIVRPGPSRLPPCALLSCLFFIHHFDSPKAYAVLRVACRLRLMSDRSHPSKGYNRRVLLPVCREVEHGKRTCAAPPRGIHTVIVLRCAFNPSLLSWPYDSAVDPLLPLHLPLTWPLGLETHSFADDLQPRSMAASCWLMASADQANPILSARASRTGACKLVLA